MGTGRIPASGSPPCNKLNASSVGANHCWKSKDYDMLANAPASAEQGNTALNPATRRGGMGPFMSKMTVFQMSLRVPYGSQMRMLLAAHAAASDAR